MHGTTHKNIMNNDKILTFFECQKHFGCFLEDILGKHWTLDWTGFVLVLVGLFINALYHNIGSGASHLQPGWLVGRGLSTISIKTKVKVLEPMTPNSFSVTGWNAGKKASCQGCKM